MLRRPHFDSNSEVRPDSCLSTALDRNSRSALCTCATVLERYEHITRRLSTEVSDRFNTIGPNPKRVARAQPRRRLAGAGSGVGVSEGHSYFSLIHCHDKMIKIWKSAERSLWVQRSEKDGHFLASKIWLSRHGPILEGMTFS